MARDGTYKGGLLLIQIPGYYTFHGPSQLTVTLTNQRHRGTFHGARPASSVFKVPAVKISGSFSC